MLIGLYAVCSDGFMGRQVHFIDGTDGGYSLAAQAMKQRLAALLATAARP